MSLVRATLSAVALLFIACSSKGPVQPHHPLGTDAEPLRSAFNADTGHVRAIVLASPT
jgi:hypothetical protein